MKEILIISVGRLKSPYWRAAAEHYQQRLSAFVRLGAATVRDADSGLPVQARRDEEARRILRAVPSGRPLICLDERGTLCSSREFATYLATFYDSSMAPCFAVGGAFGLGEEIRQRASRLLSFSPMTFPHELAQVMLLEQLYRAHSILTGTGYHH